MFSLWVKGASGQLTIQSSLYFKGLFTAVPPPFMPSVITNSLCTRKELHSAIVEQIILGLM